MPKGGGARRGSVLGACSGDGFCEMRVSGSNPRSKYGYDHETFRGETGYDLSQHLSLQRETGMPLCRRKRYGKNPGGQNGDQSRVRNTRLSLNVGDDHHDTKREKRWRKRDRTECTRRGSGARAERQLHLPELR